MPSSSSSSSLARTLAGLAAGAIAPGAAHRPRPPRRGRRQRHSRRVAAWRAAVWTRRPRRARADAGALAADRLGGLLLGALAYLVCRGSTPARFDASAAGGATDTRPVSRPTCSARHPPRRAHGRDRARGAGGDRGDVRRPSRWVVPFLVLVLAGNGLITHDDQGAGRPRPADAQPDRGDARAVVPERPLVAVGRVLRRHRAPARRGRSRRARTLIAGAGRGMR